MYVSVFGLKMARKELKHKETKKKSISAPMVFRTTAGESNTLGLKSRSDEEETANNNLPKLVIQREKLKNEIADTN